MTADFEEKRTFQRLHVQTTIEYQVEGGADADGTVQDLSAGGVCFKAAEALAPATRLRITIRGGADEQPLTGVAVVLRCHAAPPGYAVACALEVLE